MKKFLIFFLFLLFLFPYLIKSQNICPFEEFEDILNFYIKGINPGDNQKNNTYKWEYIHCINGYSNSAYLLRDTKNPYFNDNAGIFIGSSINLGKLNPEFIEKNLTGLNRNTREILKNLSGIVGDEAENKYINLTLNLTLNLTDDETNYINEKVYNYYEVFMRSNFTLDKKNLTFSFKLNLLAFYVKYYGMDNYINEALKYFSSNNLYVFSYFLLNIKSDNYNQRKLSSMVSLSSNTSYIDNKYAHIGIYYDSKLNKINEPFFKEFIQNFITLYGLNDYFYSLGNYTDFIFEEPQTQREFLKFIKDYSFSYNFTLNVTENITEGISRFKNDFNITLIDEHYYKKHLIIFINELNPDIKINTEYFEKNGIQVILFVKINQKSDETKILKIFNDTFNIITFYNYSSLNNYLNILGNLINYHVHNIYYDGELIEIKNITTYGKNNMKNFKIIYNRSSIVYTNNIYFKISLLYDDPFIINTKYKNNSNMTFYVNENHPYADILTYVNTSNKYINFCLNDTVSSNIEHSPFIKYKLDKDEKKNYFYITIVANDIKYSLNIELQTASLEPISNGLYKNGNIHQIDEEGIYTFDSSCFEYKCNVDYISLLKYFSSGVHYTKEKDFKKIVDPNLLNCLYKNCFCPYYEKENKMNLKHEPYIGYGINLFKQKNEDYLNASIPLYIINKLQPFLSNIFEPNNYENILNSYNLFLTYEEMDILNMNYIFTIFYNLSNNYRKFKEITDNFKLSLILRIMEEHPTENQINLYLKQLASNELDKYLKSLIHNEENRMSRRETINFQLMLIQTKTIYKLRKCLISFVIGKSLLWSEQLYDLLAKFTDYRISLTYYDDKEDSAEIFNDFTDDVKEILDKINKFKETSSIKRTEKVDMNKILHQQKKLFSYYDEGIKRCIVIISIKEEDSEYKYEFLPPDKNIVENLYESGINIFDYSDHINFILEEQDESQYEYTFYNSTKRDFIQFVPFLNYSDISKNYITLSNIINRYPIPINKIQDIYLDLDPDEEIYFEFNLTKEIKKLKKKEYFDQYFKLRFTFDTSNISIYFSESYIFPNKYCNENHDDEINKRSEKISLMDESGNIFYDLSNLNENNSYFFMSVHTSHKLDDSIIKLELCDKDGVKCLKEDFYFKFYLVFIIFGVLIFLYGVYICFCETTFKREGNIFKIK